MLLRMVYNVALADRELNKKEADRINEIVTHLGITPNDHQRIKEEFIPTATAYSVLGVDSSSSDEKVKKAYRELVKKIGEIIGKHRPVVSIPPFMGYIAGWIIGRIVNDVMITKEEIKGLMANLLYVESPPTGSTKLTEWAQKHSDTLGLKYTSELARRTDRKTEYKSN